MIAAEAEPGSISAIFDLWSNQNFKDFLGVVLTYTRIRPKSEAVDPGKPDIVVVKIACNHRLGINDHTGAGLADWAHGILTRFQVMPFIYVVDGGTNLHDNFFLVRLSSELAFLFLSLYHSA